MGINNPLEVSIYSLANLIFNKSKEYNYRPRIHIQERVLRLTPHMHGRIGGQIPDLILHLVKDGMNLLA